MELPPELRAPPPRDPATAKRFLARGQGLARGIILTGLALAPAMVGLLWLKFGALDSLSIGMGIGVGGFVSLIGVGLTFNQQRALALFTQGHAGVGRVVDVKAMGDGTNDARYVMLTVELVDAHGATRRGTVVTLAQRQEVDARTGTEVAVLSLATDRRFAVFTPSLGLVAGALQK
jgi:hypothetical protein